MESIFSPTIEKETNDEGKGSKYILRLQGMTRMKKKKRTYKD